MAFETIQRVFNSSGTRVDRTVIVNTNGGQVTIEASYDGAKWVLTDTVAINGGYVVYQGASKLRLTPTGGAEYEFI